MNAFIAQETARSIAMMGRFDLSDLVDRLAGEIEPLSKTEALVKPTKPGDEALTCVRADFGVGVLWTLKLGQKSMASMVTVPGKAPAWAPDAMHE
jgi:hypothetical protein